MEQDARAEAAFEQAARLERKRKADSVEAEGLVRQFAKDAAAQGIEARRLTAKNYKGTARYRTNVVGWYLKRDKSIGVDTEGNFFILNTAGGLAARLRGVTLTPAEPATELGRGARDGESMPLTEAIAKRLEAGNSW